MLLRMMILPEGLAGHCLTVIRSLQPVLGGAVVGGWISKRGGGEEKERRKRAASEERERRGTWGKEKPPETIVFYGDRVSLGQTHRIYWTVPQQLSNRATSLSSLSSPRPQQSGRLQRGKGVLRALPRGRVCKENLEVVDSRGRGEGTFSAGEE